MESNFAQMFANKPTEIIFFSFSNLRIKLFQICITKYSDNSSPDSTEANFTIFLYSAVVSTQLKSVGNKEKNVIIRSYIEEYNAYECLETSEKQTDFQQCPPHIFGIAQQNGALLTVRKIRKVLWKHCQRTVLFLCTGTIKISLLLLLHLFLRWVSYPGCFLKGGVVRPSCT